MIKKHCDRCDSIIKERRPMNVFEKFAASVTRSDYSYCITKTFADAETSKIDLCEKCLKEFENRYIPNRRQRMNDEEAINQLKDMQSRCTNGYDAEAINNAIKALERGDRYDEGHLDGMSEAEQIFNTLRNWRNAYMDKGGRE